MATFSPERAAQLHNDLVHKAIQHDATIVTERNLLDRFRQVTGMGGELQQHPLYRFLSLLESTPAQSSGWPTGLFTPVLYQPDPSYFWDETSELHPDYILLYGQNNADSPVDGGIYLSLSTATVVWRNAPHDFPGQEETIPLEDFYKMLLRNWETGKYFFDSRQAQISVRWWRQSDVDEALAAWGRLLSAIESRLPQTSEANSHKRLAPLDSVTLEKFSIGKFAKSWLPQAARPSFKYIAPGLSTFTVETFLQIYGAEAPDSYRQSSKSFSKDEISSLLFPSDVAVPETISSSSTNWEISSFEKDYGAGKFTVARRAGLYTDCLWNHDADTVRLIHPSGLSSIVEFDTLCPWDQGRGPRLAEVLQSWTLFIEGGVWDIDSSGVANDIEWFSTHASEAKLNWKKVIEQQLAN
jgi:hypothetical protein